MLRDRAAIAHIGLSGREVAVIRSLLALVPALQNAYDFRENQDPAGADVIFVNADDEKSLENWRTVAAVNTFARPVMVSDSGTAESAEVRTVKRPLVLKKLVGVLDSVTSTSPHPVIVPPQSRVLVVDDSYPVRRFMEQKLTELSDKPLHVEFAASGMEAQQRLAEHAFELVFLDVVMPGIDGYKLCKWIKARYLCKVVMLTSKKSAFDKVRGAMAGCDTYLTKPPREEALRTLLINFLGEPERTPDDSLSDAALAR